MSLSPEERQAMRKLVEGSSWGLLSDSDIRNKWRRCLDRIDELERVIAGFYDAIAHGDDDHRKWLRTRVDSYLKEGT